MQITSAQAEILIAAAKSKAIELGVAASIVVLDSGAHLKVFLRMDGAWLGSIDVAMKKARTSVLFERENQMVWEACKPGGEAHGIELTNGHPVTFAGGIPISTANGVMLGSIGVSGGKVAQDYEIALAGLAAFVR